MTPPRLPAVAFFLILGAVLPISTSIDPGAEAGHEDARVLVLAQPFARADAIWMAQKNGFFKEENVMVSVKWVSSSADAQRAFLAGREGARGAGDFIVLTELSAVHFWENVDRDFVVIAVLARDAGGYAGIARAEVKSVEDLKAQRVATRLGSTSAWFLGEYLRAHGMSERDVALKNEGPEASLAWDVAGSDVMAFFVREPHAGEALAKHGDRVRLLTTARGYAQGYCLLGTWKRYLNEHPGVAERLLKALDRGRLHAAGHKDEVIEFARGMFSADNVAAVEADYGNAERVVGLDGVTMDDFQRLGRWMQEAGLLTTPFDPKTFFDPEPLRTSLPERVSADFGW
jgi:ABC-type nitrate/sulfonate/bicarbonate transport system substrate-binding protein